MQSASSAFEETYRRYLKEAAGRDLAKAAPVLGIGLDGETALIPFLGATYSVNKDGVRGPDGKRPLHAVSVVLLKYLILAPDEIPADDTLVAYREFADAAPFVGGFIANCENSIAKRFAGRLDLLADSCARLGGQKVEGYTSHDLSMKIPALPRVPLLMLFSDEDDEFPAACSVLFEKRAKEFLDMECLAITGWLLADFLSRAAGDTEWRTIM